MKNTEFVLLVRIPDVSRRLKAARVHGLELGNMYTTSDSTSVPQLLK
jgi:hypothetical protein